MAYCKLTYQNISVIQMWEYHVAEPDTKTRKNVVGKTETCFLTHGIATLLEVKADSLHGCSKQLRYVFIAMHIYAVCIEFYRPEY